jgi:serine/threonine protein kinase
MDLAPGTRIDRYVVEQLIGRGGMAVVYRVRHAQLGSLHALKVLTLQSEAVQERLMREGRAQSSLRHPNIVPVTDVVVANGCPALVMELVEGPSLAQLLASTRLTLEQSDLLARGILRGMAEAHRQGLVHRDLKPGNVLIALHDGELTPKITDFGLAKSVADTLGDGVDPTKTGQTMGTAPYMAPEQVFDAKNIDARADIFSLGAVLYEMVTGEQAFSGDNQLVVFNAVIEGRYPPPTTLVEDLPPRMDSAIGAALTVDADERVGTCEQLLHLWREGAPAYLAPDALLEVWDDALLEQVSTLGQRITRSADDDTPPPEDPVQRTAPYSTMPVWDTDEDGLPREVERIEDLATVADDPAQGYGPAPLPLGRLAASFAFGCLLGAPFLIGTLAWIFGGGDKVIGVGGPGMFFITGFGVLSFGSTAALAAVWRAGHRPAAPWLLFPLLTATSGAAATLAGCRNILQGIPAYAAEQPDRLTFFLNHASSVALFTDYSGLVLAAMTLLAAAGALTWAQWPEIPAQGAPRRVRALAVLALGGGSMLWAIHPAITSRAMSGGPAPFLVFLVLAIWALFAGLLACEARSRSARWVVAACGVLAVAAAAKAVDIQQQIHVFQRFRHLAVVEGLEEAERFAIAVGGSGPWPLLAWTGLAIAIALVALPGSGGGFPLPGRALALPAVLLLQLGLVRTASTDAIEQVVEHVVPAYLAAGARWHLGFAVEDRDHGVVALDVPAGHEVREGDVVLAVQGHTFDDVRELLLGLRACTCANGEPCPFGDGCLTPGHGIELDLVRGGGRLETVTVTWLGGMAPAELRISPQPLELPVGEPEGRER